MTSKTIRALVGAFLAVALTALSSLALAGTASASPVDARVAEVRSGTLPSYCGHVGLGLPTDWVARGCGYFYTSDSSDLLAYRILPDAAPQGFVRFRLVGDARCLWGKRLWVPTAYAWWWSDIYIDPSQGYFDDTALLPMWSLRPEFEAELQKSRGVWGMHRVARFRNLETIPSGSEVEITWISDSWSCSSEA